jgi:hypothetical protein
MRSPAGRYRYDVRRHQHAGERDRDGRERRSARPANHQPGGEEDRGDLDGRGGHDRGRRADILSEQGGPDSQQHQYEDDPVHLHVVEVVEEELGTQQHGERERHGGGVTAGERAGDDVPRQEDGRDPEPEIEEGDQDRRYRQREQGQRGEDQRREGRVLEGSRAREVAVVERRPGGEVPPGLPEHGEILADVLPKALRYGQGQAHGDGAERQKNAAPVLYGTTRTITLRPPADSVRLRTRKIVVTPGSAPRGGAGRIRAFTCSTPSSPDTPGIIIAFGQGPCPHHV